MSEKTITERVLEALAEEPMTPVDLGRKLNLTIRRSSWITEYHWEGWRFGDAERAGLIVLRNGKWHLVKKDEK